MLGVLEIASEPVREPNDDVQGRADFMAGVRQEGALRSARLLCGLFRSSDLRDFPTDAENADQLSVIPADRGLDRLQQGAAAIMGERYPFLVRRRLARHHRFPVVLAEEGGQVGIDEVEVVLSDDLRRGTPDEQFEQVIAEGVDAIGILLPDQIGKAVQRRLETVAVFDDQGFGSLAFGDAYRSARQPDDGSALIDERLDGDVEPFGPQVVRRVRHGRPFADPGVQNTAFDRDQPRSKVSFEDLAVGQSDDFRREAGMRIVYPQVAQAEVLVG